MSGWIIGVILYLGIGYCFAAGALHKVGAYPFRFESGETWNVRWAVRLLFCAAIVFWPLLAILS